MKALVVERVVAFALRFPAIVFAGTLLIVLGGIIAIWELERQPPSSPPHPVIEPRSQPV